MKPTKSATNVASKAKRRAAPAKGKPLAKTKPQAKRLPKKSGASTGAALSDLLRSIARVFDDVDATWFVFGAQALAMYGVPRATADVDVTVRLQGTPSQLLASLAKHGFQIHIAPAEIARFITDTRVIPAVHVASHIPLDIVLAGPGLEELMLTRATVHRLHNLKIPVIAMEDFLVLKILAGRAKDDQDVRLLVAARLHDIDVQAVAQRIVELEQILDQSDLSPKWQDLLATAISAKAKPLTLPSRVRAKPSKRS